MAASLGGLRAYSELLSALPGDFPLRVLLMEHRSPSYDHLLVELLRKQTALQVKAVRSGEIPRAGVVYVAPADLQLVVTPARRLRLTMPGAGMWPLPRCTADPLFASVAAVYGARAIGVVLTGMSADGAIGVQAIKRIGGRVLVQDVRSSEAVQMPKCALATGCSDFALPPKSLAHALISLVMVPGAAELFRVSARPWG